jgi:hypothetical protein
MRRLMGLLIVLGVPTSGVAQEPKNLSDLCPDFMVVTEFDAAVGQLQLGMT